MPEGYGDEIRDAAEELFVADGMTYDQVAGATGVSVAQLKRWGKDGGWTEARKEHREAQRSIRRGRVRLRAALLEKAIDSQDPQSVYAYAAIERAVGAGKKGDVAEAAPAPEKVRQINTPEEAVAALQEVVEMKINRVLARPETLKLSDVRELKDTMAMIGNLKAQFAPAKGNPRKIKEMDPDAMQTIKDIYGLTA